ncbi:MAG: ATP-binding cassette domain-containing protein [Candidatus Geothermincolia bacterium]
MSLELREVSFTYLPGTPLARTVLASVELRLEPGELLCIVGLSGSGKSTLAQLMNGLLEPSRGAVFLDGEPASPRRLRHSVGLVFQNAERQLFAETVEADIGFGPRNQGLSRTDTAARVERAATRLGIDLADIGRRSPFSLSQGQRRRVAIAGVLALETPYLVLDEPGAGLDGAGRKRLLALLAGLRDAGRGVAMVTHQLEDALRLADRVLLLSEGRVVALGPASEVLADRALLESAGYRLPPLLELMAALGRRGLAIPRFARDEVEACLAITTALRDGASR